MFLDNTRKFFTEAHTGSSALLNRDAFVFPGCWLCLRVGCLCAVGCSGMRPGDRRRPLNGNFSEAPPHVFLNSTFCIFLLASIKYLISS